MSIVSQGKFIGRSSSFKYRKSGGIGSGINLSAQRKDSLEKRAISDKQDKETARTKEVSRREKERKQRRIQMVKRVSEETNTEKRQKVVAVSRPDTANTPLDARSKLYKQTQIKNKIIDENEVKTMTFQKYHGLPDSLVSAVTAILEKVKNPFEDDDKKTKSKKDDDQDDTDDMDMKSNKNDDSDDNEDDDSDRKVGTNGKKTKVELNPKTQSANEELKGNQHKLDKNKNGRLDKHDFKLLRKEEVEHIEEGNTHTVWFQKGTKVGARSARGIGVIAKNEKHAIEVAKQKFPDHKNGWFVDKIKSYAKEEVEEIDELSNKTLGNYVKKAGRQLRSGTAPKGRDERSDLAKLKIAKRSSNSRDPYMDEEVELDEAMKWDKKSHASLPAMDQPNMKAHKEAANWHRENYEDSSGDAKQYHKKRMLHHTTQADAMKSMSESKQFDIGLSDEETQRILTKLKESDDKAYKYRDTDPADKNNDYDASKDKNPEHIVMQLRKAKSLGAANRPIHFHDGSKANVSSAHVHKALDMHNSFKKAPDRDDFTQKLQASHASFKKALGEQ
jgi:hypothetical protein